MQSEATLNDTLAERGSTHGSYPVQAQLSQDLKDVMGESPNWDRLPPHMKETLEMVALKVSRVLTGDFNNPDNFLDLAGYSMLAYRELVGPSK